jgi:hypothetical protein
MISRVTTRPQLVPSPPHTPQSSTADGAMQHAPLGANMFGQHASNSPYVNCAHTEDVR